MKRLLLVALLVGAMFLVVGCDDNSGDGAQLTDAEGTPVTVETGDDTADEIVETVHESLSCAQCTKQWNDGEIGFTELVACCASSEEEATEDE